MVRWFDGWLVWCWLFLEDLLKAIWIRWPQVLKMKLGFRTIFQNPFISVRECLCLWVFVIMFHFILGEIEDLITKETTRFKKPISPECQLALTLYRMAHGISFSTVGDLFGVVAPTAWQIFSTVTSAIVTRLYDRSVCLPRNEEEWKKELCCFLENWEFPCCRLGWFSRVYKF